MYTVIYYTFPNFYDIIFSNNFPELHLSFHLCIIQYFQ